MRAVILLTGLTCTSGCFIEAFAGGERTTFGEQRGTGWVAGASIGTVWGGPEVGAGPVVVGGGLATSTHRSGATDAPIAQLDADTIHGRVDVNLTKRLALAAMGDYGWIRRVRIADEERSQVGRVLGGTLALAVDVAERPYQRWTLSAGATYHAWRDLGMTAGAMGGELRMRVFFTSPLAFGCGKNNCAEQVTTTKPDAAEGGGSGGILDGYTPSTPDAPLPSRQPQCTTTTTCSTGAFGRNCSSSTSCI